ncbi:response regulator transcription factor [Shewanella sp. GutDb-MelDb]|uniref:response regulator transcription factor n=1 Tax=Shewanella sp. GutDb-MelDb TaxID=2058316 RepID=UPI000C7ACCBE|nr:response regulator transcription factor [Shewanella sp. GutDb-MelDb]PKG59073.1 DNA-binding response regulator [Shewanella sp. GutDb-MelDb]
MNNRFLIVDDHPLICEAFKTFLFERIESESINYATDYKQAIRIYRLQKPNFLIIDLNLGNNNESGLQLFSILKKDGFEGKALCVSSQDNLFISKAASNLGFHGFIDKAQGIESISLAIKMILDGYKYFKNTEDNKSLSNREAEIANYLINGLSNKEISKHLSLSEKTISTYKFRILMKYNVKSTIELSKIISMDFKV